MRKILVTGATGFIGRYVIDRLLSEGHSVIATSAHEQRAREFAWFDRVLYIPFDLADFNPAVDYYRFFHEPDAFIHLAWEGLPQYKADFHLQVNYPRHAALLDNLVRHGLRDITVTGTCLEYGMQEGRLSEDLPAHPGNAYALAKDKLRIFLEELGQWRPFTFKWVRLFYMYGKGQAAGSLIPQLDKALQNGETTFNMSGGEQVRDYLPVGQLADYLVRISLQDKVTGIVNCCSGVGITVRKLVDDYLQQQHQTIRLNYGHYPYPDYEPMRFWGDNSRLKTILANE
jgi:nucleoside-diphosphate-sugar epimerase